MNGSAANSTRTDALSGAELEALEESSEKLTAEQARKCEGQKHNLNIAECSQLSMASNEIKPQEYGRKQSSYEIDQAEVGRQGQKIFSPSYVNANMACIPQMR